MNEELLVIRTSERKTWTRCRQQWWWAYREHLTPRVQKPALRFGDLVHQALAAYYIPSKSRTRVVRGPHPVKNFLAAYDRQLQEFQDFGMYADDEWIDARVLGEEMLTNYIDEYGADKRYRIVQPEADFQVDLYTEYEEYICTYVGTCDAIVEDLSTGLYGLFEHKTAAAINTAHLTLDEQAGSYWAILPDLIEERLLGKMDFILYNFLRKGSKDDRPVNELGQHLNKDGTVSKRQPPPLFKREIVRRTEIERRNTLERIDAQAEEIAWVDEGSLKVYKNPTRDCSWDCDFFDMCELHEMGADWEGYRDVAMVKWDPYQAHNEALGEKDKPSE